MLAVIRFTGSSLEAAGEDVLAVLAGRPGFERGSFARSSEDDSRWVLVTEWVNVGAYRRAIQAGDTRIAGAALFACAADEPAGYDVLVRRSS